MKLLEFFKVRKLAGKINYFFNDYIMLIYDIVLNNSSNKNL